jgi:hypothetical protein
VLSTRNADARITKLRSELKQAKHEYVRGHEHFDSLNQHASNKFIASLSLIGWMLIFTELKSGLVNKNWLPISSYLKVGTCDRNTCKLLQTSQQLQKEKNIGCHVLALN